ncbi:hypothetical protein QNH28_19900 [Paenibacillus sp. G2S3]|uniref:hypothetical protein n=1 Tax=Paenibacillus sp. G2S3 TaxID=3047872 RepID=UPI0024C0F542|nr:hypothetical protein [Paenibacillus sp. G2S3]WHY17753.1 hypothetical protein QNH28_19900 [Paenibacillus sp. G2S3]
MRMGTGGRRDRVTLGDPRRWGAGISGQAGVLDIQAELDFTGARACRRKFATARHLVFSEASKL